MTNVFGKIVRRQREALLSLDPAFGLRQTAARAGLQPSYLSRIERGRVAPPSAAAIARLAEAVGLDPDELLAVAGKLPDDVSQAILKRPSLMAGLVRQFAKVSDDGIRRAILRARRTGRQ